MIPIPSPAFPPAVPMAASGHVPEVAARRLRGSLRFKLLLVEALGRRPPVMHQRRSSQLEIPAALIPRLAMLRPALQIHEWTKIHRHSLDTG